MKQSTQILYEFLVFPAPPNLFYRPKIRRIHFHRFPDPCYRLGLFSAFHPSTGWTLTFKTYWGAAGTNPG